MAEKEEMTTEVAMEAAAEKEIFDTCKKKGKKRRKKGQNGEACVEKKEKKDGRDKRIVERSMEEDIHVEMEGSMDETTKMNWYLRQSAACLILLVFVALASGSDYLDGDVALKKYGLVNIYYNGKWGTICLHYFYQHLMSVAVCRSLGLKYSNYGRDYTRTPAFLSGTFCRGDENSLMGCVNPRLSNYYYHCSYKLRALCKDNPLEKYCSFDNNNCNMTISGSAYIWKRTLASTPSEGGRPRKDHSTGTKRGKYMLASATGFPGQKTYLETEAFGNVSNSFNFYYHMTGKDAGKLNVYVQSQSRQILMKSVSGNQGNQWKYACIPLGNKYGKVKIIFEAVQGDGYNSDIAIDDLTLSTNNCSFWNASCSFREDTCNYDIDSTSSQYGWKLGKFSGLSDRSGYGYYLTYTGSYYNRVSSTLTSPPLNLPPMKTKVTFNFYMEGRNSGELQLRFLTDGDQEPWQTDASYFWQESGGHGSLWQIGCMELPNKTGKIQFDATSGKWSGKIALDNIDISNGSCQIGITNHVCTFDNPSLCNYTIDCKNPNEYTWRRNYRSTPSSYTGPNTDQSKLSDGYYIYAEASYGSPNDTSLLNFAVRDVRGKFLIFAYNMYGDTVGNLRVRFTYDNSQHKDVWTRKGNQGKYWHKACVYIRNEINVITFIATRGTSYTGDIAIDTISVGSKGCGGPFQCDFQENSCNYRVSGSGFSWDIKEEYLYSSDANKYLYIHYAYYGERYTFQLTSPYASVANGTSVSFRYKISKYAQEFALFAHYKILPKGLSTNTSYSEEKLWSSSGNELTEFTTACVDLPPSNNLSLTFQVVPKSGYSPIASLDDIIVSNETCKLGIAHHFCEFKEVDLCDYNVECSENSEYTWQRGSYKDASNYYLPYQHGSEYYMYTNSSKGKLNDTARLVFQNILTPASKSLHFSHYISEKNGKLQLQSKDSYGNLIELFKEFGIVEDRSWNFACVNIPNYSINYTYEFVATRGFASNGYIALLNVGFKEGYCEDRNISCDFSNPMICQYHNFSYYHWMRVQPGNVSGSTNDVFMQATSRYSIHRLASPVENITNSCVQIRFKIINAGCNLTIYNAFNKKILFSTVNQHTTPWLTYQTYIEKSTLTKLIFLTENVYWKYYEDYNCSVLLDHISVKENKCPELVCPPGTIKCKNEHCFNASKVCDRVIDCSDGSDEKNCYVNSISCDFQSPYYCGYKILHGVEHISKQMTNLHIPGTLQTMGRKGKILSPSEILEKSCVMFRYITQGAVIGNLSMFSNKLKSDGKVTRSLEWSDTLFNENDGVYEGQFQIDEGKLFLEIETNIVSGSLSLDDITVSKGDCPKLNCPNDTFMCPDNTKCIYKKDVCNNYRNCKDGSDENKCPNTLNCTFEDKNMCGFKSFPDDCWMLDYGQRAKNPRNDQSEDTPYGHYVRSNCTTKSRVELPKITMGDTFCLEFYYIYSGYGDLLVYGNETLLIELPKFDVEIWTNAYFTLSGGTHNISFVYSGGNITTLAIDSVVTIPGKCPVKDCAENWYTCNFNNTCYPSTEKCNGITNCPNGIDETNCGSTTTKYRLTGGRNLWSGKLNIFYGSKYLPLCTYSISESTLNEACSVIGLNGSSFYERKDGRITGDYLYCYGNTIDNCYKLSCVDCFCNVPYVYCSNTTCPFGKVSCSSSGNTFNSTNKCISKERVCDGMPDCDAGIDEENCDSCTDLQWQCKNKKCITKDLRCDGVKQCDDRSDEFHCFKYTTDKTVEMFYKGSYKPICENNLNNEEVANNLCSYVGRSNGSFNGAISGDGILFKQKYSDNDDQLIPGFEPQSTGKCNIAKLDCSEQQCGTRMMGSLEPSTMSNSGQLTLDREFPWTVSVHHRYYYITIAVIIDSHHVLAPARQLMKVSPKDIHIKVGSTWRDGGDEHDVDEIWIQKEHTKLGIDKDFAILHVKNKIKMSSSAQPICLPDHPMPRGINCYAVGFGKVSDRSEEKKVKKVKPSFCKKHFPLNGNSTFCANDRNDKPPHCSYDFGNYVTCLNDHGKWTVYGIGADTPCYEKTLSPSPYIDVYKEKKWIEEHI